MKKRTTLKASFKSTVLMLGLISMPMMVSAQSDWKWEVEAENYSELVYGRVAHATADGHQVSGGAYVEELSVGKDSKLGFVIQGVPAPGMYDLSISYISMQERYLLIQIADRTPIVVDCSETTGSWNGVPTTETDEEGVEISRPGVVTKTVTVYIPYEDENDLIIKAFDGYSASEKKNLSFAPNIDKITVTPSNAALQVTPKAMKAIEFEAETTKTLSGSARPMNENTASLSGQAGITLGSNGRVEYKVTVPEAGTYALYIDYTTMQTRWIYAKVNSQPKQYMEFNEKTPSWGDKASDDVNKPTVYKKALLVYLEEGENTILLNSHNGATSEHSDSPNLDKMTLRKVVADMEKPGYELVAYPFDFTELAKLSSDKTTDLTNLVDNDERTSTKIAGVKEATFVAELLYPIALTGYAVASPNDMSTWKVQGSSDKQNWTDLGSTGATAEGIYQQHTVAFDQNAPVSFPYYRLLVSGDKDIDLAEWQLFGSICMTPERPLLSDMFDGDDTRLTASEDGWNASEAFGERFQYIVDGLLNTKFTADKTKSPTEKSPIWFLYDFGNEKLEAQSYSLTVPWSLADRNPKSWILYGYSDEAKDWVVLDSRQNMRFPSVSSTLIFNMKNSIQCSGYKLEITANNGSRDNTQLTAWQLFPYKFPISDQEVSIKDIQADDATCRVYSVNNTIVITSDKKVSYRIYNLSGQKINENVVEGTAEACVPSGFYIVVVNGVATKVMTR